MRLVALVVVVGAVALLSPAAASAKWCLRITATPAAPTAGAKVTLRVRTFEPVAHRGGGVTYGRPLDLGSLRLMLLLQPPRGQPIALELRRSRTDRSIRRTTFVFRTPGTWRLRSIDETPVPPHCRGRLALRVRPRP